MPRIDPSNQTPRQTAYHAPRLSQLRGSGGVYGDRRESQPLRWSGTRFARFRYSGFSGYLFAFLGAALVRRFQQERSLQNRFHETRPWPGIQLVLCVNENERFSYPAVNDGRSGADKNFPNEAGYGIGIPFKVCPQPPRKSSM